MEVSIRASEKICIPTVALRGMVILPRTIIHFDLSRKKSIAAVEQAMVVNQRIFLVTQKETEDKIGRASCRERVSLCV